MAKSRKKTKKTVQSSNVKSTRAKSLSGIDRLLADFKALQTPRVKTTSKEESLASFFFSSDKEGFVKNKEALSFLSRWQQDKVLSAPNKIHRFNTPDGLLLYLWFSEVSGNEYVNETALQATEATRLREACGALTAECEVVGIDLLKIYLLKAFPAAEEALKTGMELASYRYLKVASDNASFQFEIHRPAKETKETNSKKTAATDSIDGKQLAVATNIARHLVNLPPNELHPYSYAEVVKSLFKNMSYVNVDIWDEKRLEKENMGLLLAVGRAAPHAPRLVHISYRPKKSKEKQPWAFVGKGITFDSGGLDIKPPSAMRWMKKDMGGSAAVVGFAWWCVCTGVPQAMDFYLSLAENAVGSQSFRPGDILTSRSGHTVEISNTDAEGRLVLADALDVAVTQTGKDKPSLVINVATLTGAIKVGLGSQLAGLFANSTDLRDELFAASQVAGDLCWPMPLFQEYRPSMGSNFATMTNSVEGFGGAVTAALFLESFVKKTPWAHLDIYAWKDSAGGALLEAGGNGQGVQLLAHWARRRLK